jgi:hypothetical protein
MNSQTLTFVQDLFARCSNTARSATSAPACVTFTAIHPDGDRPTPSRHLPLGDSAALQRALMRLLRANEHGWGAYIGIAPRKRNLGRWGRGTRRDLLCLPALFVDIDIPDDALRDLETFELPPSCILKSGHGYHAYWFLGQPTTEFARADRILRGLAEHLHGDEKLTVAQSMRLPGTINTKPGRENAACAFISYHPEQRYSFDAFNDFIPEFMSHPRHDASPDDLAGTVPHSVLDVLTAAVLQKLDGFPGGSGYIRACCPFHHERDRPGMHFSYNPESGWGHCFGKHGKIPPADLCRRLGVQTHSADQVHFVRRHILDPLWSAALVA